MSDVPAKQSVTRSQVLVVVLALLGGVYYFTAGRERQEKAVAANMADIQHRATVTMANIENKVATDAVAQYEIAKRQGDPMQTCVQAGMVSAAFLQAKNEPQYDVWKATEKADCAKAGLQK
jgi:hypothetical protein